jgi:hypothetical protein
MTKNCLYNKGCKTFMSTDVLVLIMESQLSQCTCLNFESIKYSLITSIKFPHHHPVIYVFVLEEQSFH